VNQHQLLASGLLLRQPLCACSGGSFIFLIENLNKLEGFF